MSLRALSNPQRAQANINPDRGRRAPLQNLLRLLADNVGARIMEQRVANSNEDLVNTLRRNDVIKRCAGRGVLSGV